MFYHPHDNKATIISKHIIFWTSLGAMFALFIFIFSSDLAVPQREVNVEIDITNRVNICQPDKNDETFKKSFFGF